MRSNTINVIFFGLVAQITGFVKMLLVAHYFGVTADLDGYYLALALPSLVQGFVTGAVQTGFIPIYISLRTLGEADKASSLATAVFYRLFVFLLVLSLVLSLSSEFLITLFTPVSSPAVQEAAIACFTILAFSALANGMIDYFSLMLNAHHRYVVAALGPTINAITSSLILLMWPEWGVSNLVWGLIIGMVLQLVVSLFAINRSGVHVRLLSLAWKHDSLGRVYQLTLPILLGVALANANNTVIQFFSASIGDGAVSVLGYANRLHGAFLQVVIIGISTVLLPNFTNLVALNQRRDIHAILQKAFRMSLLIAIVMAITIGSMGTDIIAFLLQSGQFDREATENVSLIWLIYVCGLFPIAWGIFIAKYFQAVQKPWVITRLAVFSFITNVFLAWLLMRIFGLAGLAAASGLTYLLVAFGYHWAVVNDLEQPILKGETRRVFILTIIGLLSWMGITALQPLLSDLPLFVRLAGTTMLIFFTAALLAQQAGFIGHDRNDKIVS